jgi:hypothetical protein
VLFFIARRRRVTFTARSSPSFIAEAALTETIGARRLACQPRRPLTQSDPSCWLDVDPLSANRPA